jgi:hypothetical protein
MPQKEIDYLNTIIYKIVCNELSVIDIYVGHTTDFIKRKYSHKTRCNNIDDKRHFLKLYKYMRDNGGWDNFTMIEIEKYPCKDGNEARARERYWLETLSSSLNISIPHRTRQETSHAHYEKNKEKIIHYNTVIRKDYHDNYYIENKDEIRKRSKENYEKRKLDKFTCECGITLSVICKPKHLTCAKHKNYLMNI